MNVALRHVHLLSALTMGRYNLSDNDAISAEDDDERNKISQQRIDPVPNVDKEMPELVVNAAVRRLADRFDDVNREEEVDVDTEQYDGDCDPDNDDAST